MSRRSSAVRFRLGAAQWHIRYPFQSGYTFRLRSGDRQPVAELRMDRFSGDERIAGRFSQLQHATGWQQFGHNAVWGVQRRQCTGVATEFSVTPEPWHGAADGVGNCGRDVHTPRAGAIRKIEDSDKIEDGGMAERLNAPVLKTVRVERLSGVRIPLPPPF